MNIAIHTTELEQERIDGTRMYLWSLLERFARFAPDDTFYLLHKKPFHSRYSIPSTLSYRDMRLPALPLWTQTAFASALFRIPAQVLWLPIHNIPRYRPRHLQTVVTIHDLAFLTHPQTYPRRDYIKLCLQTAAAVAHATKLIAVSQTTKDMLLTHYPTRDPSSIAVIHHGYDHAEWHSVPTIDLPLLRAFYDISQEYIIYTGAIQPRKNITTLIAAFEAIKAQFPRLQLVLLGSDAWRSSEIHARIKQSPVAKDIILTGGVEREKYRVLLRGARIFVHPGIAEGFGMTILDAFAARVPVIAADSGSLPEIAGTGAMYFPPDAPDVLAQSLTTLLQNPTHAQKLVAHGDKILLRYSWDTCAQKTLTLFHELKASALREKTAGDLLQ